MILESVEEAEAEKKRRESKFGPYTGGHCENCGRIRVMLGADGFERCEKCAWVQGGHGYDPDLQS